MAWTSLKDSAGGFRPKPGKSFREMLQELEEQQANLSDSVEPDFCDCGAQIFTDKDSMDEEVPYCTREYRFIRSRRPRSLDADGRKYTWTPTEAVFCAMGECPRIKERRQEDYIKQVRSTHKDMLFETFDRANDPANAFERVRNFKVDDNGKPGKLIIVGDRGRGKTHLARALYVQLLSERWVCRWFRSPDLAETFRRAQSGDDWEQRRESEETFQHIKKADCLFIDDLGEERLPEGSDLFHEQFKMLLEDVRALVITTNLDSKQLEKRYKEKIFDRLMENAKSAVLMGANFRATRFPKMKQGTKT